MSQFSLVAGFLRENILHIFRASAKSAVCKSHIGIFQCKWLETLYLRSTISFFKGQVMNIEYKIADNLEAYPVHTVILEYFNIKESALSNFAFQSFLIFIGTQNKKNLSNGMMHFWNNQIYPLLSTVLCTWMEPETCSG